MFVDEDVDDNDAALLLLLAVGAAVAVDLLDDERDAFVLTATLATDALTVPTAASPGRTRNEI